MTRKKFNPMTDPVADELEFTAVRTKTATALSKEALLKAGLKPHYHLSNCVGLLLEGDAVDNLTALVTEIIRDGIKEYKDKVGIQRKEITSLKQELKTRAAQITDLKDVTPDDLLKYKEVIDLLKRNDDYSPQAFEQARLQIEIAMPGCHITNVNLYREHHPPIVGFDHRFGI